LKITDLSKNYPGFSLRVRRMSLMQGRIYGLIGPNGSGKTTLMKLIAGLLEKDGGYIDYEGLTQRDITMAPRRPYLLRDNVYNNLVFPLSLRGVKPDQAQAERYLELAGLRDKRRQYAPGLSGGEQQKLSMVRALIFRPRLILMDEAFSGMDIESARAFEQLIIDRQREEPATWLIISHQLPLIRRLCDHVFFMDSGRMTAEGRAGEMLFKPQHAPLQKYLRHETLLYQGGADGVFDR
jgi:ABC-type multidrug transport system ATPase subunit